MSRVPKNTRRTSMLAASLSVDKLAANKLMLHCNAQQGPRQIAESTEITWPPLLVSCMWPWPLPGRWGLTTWMFSNFHSSRYAISDVSETTAGMFMIITNDYRVYLPLNTVCTRLQIRRKCCKKNRRKVADCSLCIHFNNLAPKIKLSVPSEYSPGDLR